MNWHTRGERLECAVREYGREVRDDCPNEAKRQLQIALDILGESEDELSDVRTRIVVIADEAFGPFAVIPTDELLNHIEHGAFIQRKRIAELEAKLARYEALVESARAQHGRIMELRRNWSPAKWSPERYASNHLVDLVGDMLDAMGEGAK